MTLLWIYLVVLGACALDIGLTMWQMSPMEPPNFMVEPPSLIYFSNTTGTLINCQGQGNPQPNITWLHFNDRIVTDIPRLREMQPNGNLYFPPFAAQSYAPEVHSATYKCALENPVGRIVSRESRIKAVMATSHELSVQDAIALQGNVAAFKCQSPELTNEHLAKTWFKMEDSRMEVGQSTPIHPGGRYVITLDGTLLVHNVVPEDTFDRYFCQVVNRYTGDQTVSQPAKIVIKQPTGDKPPVIKHRTEHTVHVKANQATDLICLAEGFPPPAYRWFRKVKDNVQELTVESLTVHPYQSLLHITRVPMNELAITYECVVSNKIGQDKHQISLLAILPFAVSAYPSKQVVDSGSTAVFNCTTQGTTLQPLFSWLKDGSPIRSVGRHEISEKGNHLTIHNVMKEDKGIYQCLARDPDTDETAQSSVLLSLGAISPELTEFFHDQVIRTNSFLSLRCTASGNPPPRIYWYLDGGLILPQGDYVFGSYMHVDGNVVSYLNVSIADVLHGGYYTCLARNILGLKSHSAMVKIYGDPIARPPSNLTVRSEDNAYLQCPVAGYPITRTAWQKDMVSIPNHSRHTLFDNGTLFIRSTQDTVDSGLYVCTKINDRGQSATGHLYLRIMKPPVVTPFQFTKDLQESERAQVSCTIKSGDLPMEFVWRKDNKIVSTNNEIELQNFKFASTLFFYYLKPQHAGLYTCIVSNSVASSNYSALLNIKVPPKWVVEPEDSAVLDTHLTVINCQAEGYPEPKITWTRISDKKQLESLNHFSESEIEILSNGSLVIRQTTNAFEDNYTCTANNGIGNLSKTVSLKVYIPAHFKEKSINKSGMVGSRVVLTCQAEGSKPLNIEWNPSLENIVTKNTNNGVISEIYLNSLHGSQTGTYTCMATNSYGYDHMTINLMVREPPETPKKLDVISVGTRWLEFRWDSVNSHVTYYVLQMNINYGLDWSNYTVSGSLCYTKISYLRPATMYTARVVAVNDFGSSNPSPNITATTLDDEPSAPPNNVEAIDIETKQMTIRWKPPDQDTWNGQIIGYKVSYADANEITEVNTKTIFGSERCEVRITNLKPYTTYRVEVRAFNSVGPGPESDFIRITTNEGVPDEPPQNVQCSPLTAESLRMSWSPPPVQSHHGTILGYKIHYKKVNPTPGTFVSNEMKKTTNLETNLHALDKYTNYSVRVLAYTRVGEGVQSSPIYCLTEQDVPGPPENVKALTVTSSSILVSWTPPKRPNGVIIKYTVHVKYNKIIEKEFVFGDKSTKIEIRRLKEFQRYEFWVTASTVVGEGQPSYRVNQSPNSRAPARVASFGELTNVVVGSTSTMECNKVGMPTPVVIWKKPDNIKTKVLSDGGLSVGPVDDETYNGNYTCHVENIFGRDQISYALNVLYPPSAPEFLVDSISTNAILVQWKPAKQPDIAVTTTGYVLTYKTGDDQPERVDVDSDRFTYTIDRLKCGSKYAITMQTVNTVGTSEVSSAQEVFTKGGVPKEPDKDAVLSVNSTSVTFSFGSWPTQMCGIRSFTCQYAARGGGSTVTWIKFPRQKVDGDTFTVGRLRPATVYTVRMVVHTDAGDTSWEHTFATRTKSGGVVPMEAFNDVSGGGLAVPSLAQMHKYVPAVSILVCVVSFCVCICVIVQKRKSTDGGDTATAAAGAARRKSSYGSDDCERIEYAAASSTLRKREGSASKTYGAAMDSYDVCPYATFSVVQASAATVESSSGGGGFRTPAAHHKALTQTDCVYETPGRNEAVSYEISYISNQQTLPMTSAKLSRKVMTPVHFVPPDVQDDQLQQCSHKMSSNTGARKQNLETRGVRRHYN